MKPDEFVEAARYVGPGMLISDDTGESIQVSCRIFLYRRMLWCGDGEPRSEGSPNIEGSVFIPGDPNWAREHLRKRFILHLSETTYVHFYIRDDSGKIGNLDSNWQASSGSR